MKNPRRSFKLGHSAGKGKEGGENGTANESEINSLACWQCILLGRIMEVRIRD
jgi:hypothetical protein